MTKTRANNVQGSDLAPLITELHDLIHSARHAVATTINTLQVMTNFEIGRRIVEHEQQGAERAEDGKELLKELSVRLSEEFGRGFSEDNLARMRKFYIVWKDRVIEFPRSLRGNSETICQKPSVKTNGYEIGQQATGQSRTQQKPSVKLPLTPIYQKPSGKLSNHKIVQRPSAQSGKSPFTLSWSHNVLLLTIKKPEERSFYEIESTQAGWSLPELKRQLSSCLYERLVLSRDRKS